MLVVACMRAYGCLSVYVYKMYVYVYMFGKIPWLREIAITCSVFGQGGALEDLPTMHIVTCHAKAFSCGLERRRFMF